MGNSAGAEAKGPYSRWEEPSAEDATFKCSPALRTAGAQPGPPPTTMKDGSSTVWEMASKAFEQHAELAHVGVRKLVGRSYEEGPGGKKFEKLHLDTSFSWMTYGEFKERIDKLGGGLATFAGLKKGDKMLIFAETQRDWMAAMLACFRQGGTIATAYATLGEEGVVAALNETGASTCVCDAKLFGIVAKAAPKCPGLKFVIPIITEADESTSEKLAEKLTGGQQVKSVEELIAMGSAVEATPPSATDTAVVMYTSGTTGKSKGVMISHENIVSQARAGLEVYTFIDTTTTYVGYLPLAHIFELFVEMTLMSQGAKIGYGNPHTLTDTGVKLAAGQKGDAALLQPTLMTFAPAILDKVYSGLKAKTAGGLKGKAFNAALQHGYSKYESGEVGCGILGNLVMGVAQKALGGQVKHIVSGSAPLSAEIQKFVQCVFNAPVRQGYGLTETCGASCVADNADNTPGQVGPPTPGTYIRLRDWDEGGYTNADKDKPEIGMRRGEVLVGGPTVCQGYWIDEKNPDEEISKKNQEDFMTIDGQRYFCTGDVGQVTADGTLMIIDRKKDLFKGDNGEYVSLSKVESLLKLSSYVEMPMAYGRTGAKSIIALISPQKRAVMEFAESKGLEGDFPTLCKHADVIKEVAGSCLKECKAGGLVAFEIPTAIALVCSPDGGPAWTPENDFLTSTMKLKRPIVAKAFKADIDDCYARSAK